MNPLIGSVAVRAMLGRRLPIAALAACAAIFAAQTPPAASVAQAQSAQPWTQNAANTAVHDHWMADTGSIGRLPLGEVILPASHDSATYGFLDQRWNGPDPPGYTTVQDIDVYTQLQHGIRALDLRGKDFTWDGKEDYYVYHGNDTTISRSPLFWTTCNAGSSPQVMTRSSSS